MTPDEWSKRPPRKRSTKHLTQLLHELVDRIVVTSGGSVKPYRKPYRRPK